MLNPIKEIVKWQRDAGNAAKPYDDFLESSFQIEEALEGFNPEFIILSMHEAVVNNFNGDITSHKDVSRHLVSTALTSDCSITDVDRLDKACDAVVFAIGSMTKLGLDHHAITKALNIVNDANKAKLGMSRDAEGKLLKPEGFVGPEVKLQELLDGIRK